ncbi:MAG: Alkyl hydroperoxide reductase C [Chlamydiia bacterium]|nr:Alkyl hydroperoxide reductase C [Chlamydiia bacterium]
MGLVGKQAPEVCTTAVVGDMIVENFSLRDHLGKYVVLFFYPLDFTFVCPTELHAFQEKYDEFKSLGAELIGCSRDSHYTHLAWLNTPKVESGIQGVQYPLMADMTLDISRSFGVLKEDEGVSYRGLFLIDKEGIVRHMLINDLPLGRNVDEALRILKALQHYEGNGEVCPANWQEGDRAFKTNKEELDDYFSN